MKKIALFFISIMLFFAVGFFLARTHPRLAKTTTPEKPAAEGRFRPAAFPIEHRPFAIVIIGRKNGALVEKTLRSAFSQQYENFRLIYIDDASDDGSFELAQDLVHDNGSQTQVTLVHNEEPLGFIANLSRASQACEDEEIVVVLHGEDLLAHEWVLQRLNQFYADPDLWLTYGQYLEYPSFKQGICRAYDKGFRESPFAASHLQTFYASLFKKIRGSDLVYQGQYIPGSGDLAYMIPLLEMACDHFQFIPEILYLATSSLTKEDRELQMKIEQHVRAQAAYAPLTGLSLPPTNEIEAEGFP
jgi:hypothetical protein